MFKPSKPIFLRALLAFGASFPCLLYAQSPSPTPPPSSDVQFMNATSIPEIDLRIRNGRTYESLRQGARISGGVFDTLEWTLEMSPSGSPRPGVVSKLSFLVPSRASSTVVLVGDFAIQKDSEGKAALRAAILPISNTLDAGEKANRLVCINGSNEPIKVSAPGLEEQEIPPLGVVRFLALPEALTFSVATVGKQISLPLEFVDFQSVAIAFFIRDGTPDYVAMPQYTNSK